VVVSRPVVKRASAFSRGGEVRLDSLCFLIVSLLFSAPVYADQLIVEGDYGLIRLSADIKQPVSIVVVVEQEVVDPKLISLKQKGGGLEIPVTKSDGGKLVFSGVAAGTWRLQGAVNGIKRVLIE
jgi:hypothetical protein